MMAVKLLVKMAVKLLVKMAVMMMAPAALRRHRKQGGEGPLLLLP